MKRVLIACEESGTVRDAFTSSGHYAMSCDLKESKSPGLHYVGDVFDIINDGWDLMIAFPPCTYLAKAQMFRCVPGSSRFENTLSSALFVQKLFNCSIPKVAIENPVGYLNTHWKPPTQIAYPFNFGDPYRKEICFWLKGLPPLMSTIYNPVRRSIQNHTNGRMSQDLKSEIKSSWQYFPGLSQAIVHQWSMYPWALFTWFILRSHCSPFSLRSEQTKPRTHIHSYGASASWHDHDLWFRDVAQWPPTSPITQFAHYTYIRVPKKAYILRCNLPALTEAVTQSDQLTCGTIRFENRSSLQVQSWISISSEFYYPDIASSPRWCIR